MITMKVTNSKLLDQKTDCYAFIVEENFTISKTMQDLAKKAFPELKALFEHHKFTGRLLSTVVLPISLHDRIVQCIFIGMGKHRSDKTIDFEHYRRAIGQAIKQASALKCQTVALELQSPKHFGVTAEYLISQTTTIANMAAYHFHDFLTDPERRGIDITQLTVCTDLKDTKSLQLAIDEGEIIGHAVNQARHWIDMPPSMVNPQFLAERAREIAKKNGLKITVFNEKQINEMGMGGLAAVSRGSELDCELVILEYKTKKKNAQTIAFVGKGITFDSGGLSIKPADSMENMKDDMSGAAGVISTMEAIAKLKPEVNIIGIAPIAENLPSGTAIKPGDIVKFYNGKTAEIKNTDAEGRLILADALSYAVKHYKPDAIIDVATLTGAVAYFLGAFYTGLLSQHDELVEKVQEASKISGERVWRLPLDEDYKVAIRTPVADLSNTGSSRYKSGTITAAWFLHNFVGQVPWVHLDIAGTAFDVPDIPYYRQGATGASVRLLIEVARNWK